MKKVLIITLYGNYNLGNKLQNYAVQKIFNSYGFETETLVPRSNIGIKESVKKHIKKILRIKTRADIRISNFKKFDEMIDKISLNKTKVESYDYVSLGSDQIWNPADPMSNYYVKLVNSWKNIPKISLSASISNTDIPQELLNTYIYHFNSMKAISVREDKGKDIIEKTTGRKDVVVTLDPTMLVNVDEWKKITKQPKQVADADIKERGYILNYFLGKMTEERKNEIDRIAKEKNLKIINILDKNDPFYTCSPDEFLWLEKNAYLICTDSFHSCVFAILFRIPFVVFNREDGQIGTNKMNSRIETLLNKFKINDRYFQEKITNELLCCDFEKVDKILEEEKDRMKVFLKNTLM
jgi:hypothetical protein